MEPDMNSILAMSSDDRGNSSSNPNDDQQISPTNSISLRPSSAKPVLGKIPSTKKVPSSNVEFALKRVEQFTSACDHEDIDINLNAENEPTEEQWTQFIDQFYAASQ